MTSINDRDRNPTLKIDRHPSLEQMGVPYASNDDLPLSVRRHLPLHAQTIFRSAFNHAWETYGGKGHRRREETAHRVAWAAVTKRYRKTGDAWVERESDG
jgi:cation transport regulator